MLAAMLAALIAAFAALVLTARRYDAILHDARPMLPMDVAGYTLIVFVVSFLLLGVFG